MGDPKKQRRQYDTPQHPWQADRIKKEAELVKTFGFRNKREIWKITSELHRMKGKAKELTAKHNAQAEKEREQLVARLCKLGILPEGAKLEQILDLTPEDLMKRRLQTIILSKNMAHSIKQARQFIKHGHILIGDRIVDMPSYMVSSVEESQISFSPSSPFTAADHPELIVQKKQEKLKPITPMRGQRNRVQRRPFRSRTAPRERAPAS